MPNPRALAVAIISAMLQVLIPASPVAADEGFATWYGQPYHGRRMANGQVYDMHDPTITANNEYPFGTWLRVTNAANGKSVDVQVRDRGGFGPGLDLSRAAFTQIAEPGLSRIRVRYEVIPGPGQTPAPKPGPQPTAPEQPVSSASAPRPAPPDAPGTSAPAPPSSPAPAAVPVVPQPNPGSYTVARGDTIGGIARRFGLKQADIVAWNELGNPNLLKPDQVLRLAAQPPPPPPAPPPAPIVARGAAAPSEQVYVVQPGDVLWQIAERLGADPHALAAANNLGEDAVLMPDQRLIVPTSQVFHTVEAGETLALIAERYETSVGAILELNEVPDPDTILPGTRLRVQ